MKQYNYTYERRKEQGICTYCGKEKAVKGQILCQKCKDKRKVKERTYDRRKRAGQCVNCGGEPEQGKVLCVYCKKLNLIKRGEKRKELHRQAKCIVCGTPKTFRDTRKDGTMNDTCHKCLEKYKSYYRKKKEEKQ